MLSWFEVFLFLAIAGGAVTAAFFTFRQMFLVIGRGQGPDTIPFDEIPSRLATAVVKLFSQGSIMRNRTFSSILHTGIAYGFIFYLIVNGVDTMEGFLPVEWHVWDAEHNYLLGNLYRLIADFLTISVLTGMSYFLIRRFLAQDPVLVARENVLLHPKVRAGAIRRDSAWVGFFMIMHVFGRFTGASALVALHGHGHGDPWQPFASLYAGILNAISVGDGGLNILWHIGWWLALGSILLFLPYFPYTKHIHLMVGPINFATRPDRGAMGALNPISFEDEENEKFGATTMDDLSQTQILDAFACIMCNRCQEACPAYNTGKQLSPAAIEINKRYHIKDQYFGDFFKGDFFKSDFLRLAADGVDELPMVKYKPDDQAYVLTESALWACTSCGACNSVCPVGNEPLHDIMDMRRAAVLERDEYPSELQNAFQGMERRGNPWGATNSRMEWAEKLPFAVPTVDENPGFEYLFWVGCAGAFDPEAQRVARSVATILNAAGMNWAVLGDQETCTGDPARRAGNEYMFNEMASANIATFDQYQMSEKRIITSCPHCMTAIGTEYKALGGDYTVFHHTQMIADLVGRGKVKLKDGILEHVTFHDPCFLGRHNGIYDEPRAALEQAGITLLEMDKSGKDSFCCGAGGAQVWKEEEEHGSDEVNVTRYEHAEATGAKTIAVGCPFCAVMLNDAKGKKGESMQVKDVAEIIADRLVLDDLPVAGD
ncbi:MAG: (Fe-S)-binding protein [Candidatus Promineifilaceae bacterium]